MKKIVGILSGLFLVSQLWGQVGGTHTYAFLNLPNAARIGALGGKIVALDETDLNLVAHNPALLNGSLNNHMTLNYSLYFAGISYGYAAYATTFPRIGTLAAGIQFVHYGDFTAADPTGIKTGTFQASEYYFHLSWAKMIDSSFTVGISLKPIYSVLENYTSFGMAADIGAIYRNDNHLLTAGLVVSNLGYQFKTYYGKVHEPLPFEIIAGISQKLAHAPFRFFLTARHLERPDLRYAQPEEEEPLNLSGFETENKETGLEKFSDNLMRHMIAGVEFIPLDNFYIRLGYNYQRRKELRIPNKVSTVGFSWGFGLKISRIHIHYGRATYHLAGSTNHFSITTNLEQLFRKNDLTY